MIYNNYDTVDEDSPPATSDSPCVNSSYITASFANTCGGISITTTTATVLSITRPPRITFRPPSQKPHSRFRPPGDCLHDSGHHHRMTYVVQRIRSHNLCKGSGEVEGGGGFGVFRRGGRGAFLTMPHANTPPCRPTKIESNHLCSDRP